VTVKILSDREHQELLNADGQVLIAEQRVKQFRSDLSFAEHDLEEARLSARVLQERIMRAAGFAASFSKIDKDRKFVVEGS